MKGNKYRFVKFTKNGRHLGDQGTITGSDYAQILHVYAKIAKEKGYTFYNYSQRCYENVTTGERFELWEEERYQKMKGLKII